MSEITAGDVVTLKSATENNRVIFTVEEIIKSTNTTAKVVYTIHEDVIHDEIAVVALKKIGD